MEAVASTKDRPLEKRLVAERPSLLWLLAEFPLAAGMAFLPALWAGDFSPKAVSQGLVLATVLVFIPSEFLRHFVGPARLRDWLNRFSSNGDQITVVDELKALRTDLAAAMVRTQQERAELEGERVNVGQRLVEAEKRHADEIAQVIASLVVSRSAPPSPGQILTGYSLSLMPPGRIDWSLEDISTGLASIASTLKAIRNQQAHGREVDASSLNAVHALLKNIEEMSQQILQAATAETRRLRGG